ncbi:Lrp/AsnC ligand binding domain-containing protein [uncultured Ruegeria sp.]|uniref:Lrp/AsnC ligand binding domain-containing protein n=1 Tax=uncultured Ruegeria sp. TaxID=259304 RepID=UPI0026332AA3|nr:Lrp/AsnC ligand binding domain-containing protein [uncultured Ruegeria sp.]
MISHQRSLLDRYDREIMQILSREGRLPVTELAARVGLSKTPCQVRLKRLISEGYIQGFKARLDPLKLGMEQVVFVEVRLTDTTERALTEFNAAVQKVPEIEQCHMIAGAFDYLLKLRTQDMRSYREILGEVVSSLPHVGSTSTHVSMQSVKDEAY